jgi:acyl-CoA synthetase (AMP-forming)/AMP-acid ligase II
MTDLQPWTSDRPAVGPGALSAPAFVLEHAARFGDKPALVDGPTGRTLTYRQLADGVERVAAGLAARGFGKGDVLALSSPNLPEYALALYGAMAAGGAVTGANPLLTAGELAGQLANAGASLLVTVPPFLETARAAAEQAGVGEVLVFGEAEGATPFRDLVAHDHPPARPGLDPARDLAALPYSSGTTGLPKGVELTHANLVANARQTQGAIEFTADDVVIGVAPFFHAIGQNLILPCSLRVGATIVTMPRFDFPAFLELIQRYRVTSTVVVPPIMLALAGHPLVDDYDLSSLRWLGCGAAPLGAEVEQRCADRLGCQVAQGFGMTEGAATFAITPLDAPRRGSAGRLLGGTEARIVDPDGGGDLGPGRTGELWLRGPQVMRGYRNHPEATARTVDPDGWLHTGDPATWTPTATRSWSTGSRSSSSTRAPRSPRPSWSSCSARIRRWPTPPWCPAPTPRPARSRSPTWPAGPRWAPTSSRPGSPSGSPPTSGSATSASSTRSRGRPPASCSAAPWWRRSGPRPAAPRWPCPSPGGGPPRRRARRRRRC